MSELDSMFNEFARAFVGTVTTDHEIAFPEHLRREDLDGSVESLHVVDEYLAFLHENRERIAVDERRSTVLWGGAYVGEVIRHARVGIFEWIDYDEYMPAHPHLHPLIPERTVASCAFLVASDGSMSMPLNKIARFIDEGPENSVHFFAHCDLAKRISKPRTGWWKSLFGKRPN